MVLSLPEVSWAKREGLVVITEHFTHSNAVPLFCHVYWPLLVILLPGLLKIHTPYSIFRGNLPCGPICFSTRREKRSKSTVQNPQVSTWQMTPWGVHHSKWTQPWEEQCNHMKPVQDFQCISLLIPSLHSETCHNLCGDVLISGQNRLKSLDAKEHRFHACLENRLMYVHYLHSLLMSIEWGMGSSCLHKRWFLKKLEVWSCE